MGSQNKPDLYERERMVARATMRRSECKNDGASNTNDAHDLLLLTYKHKSYRFESWYNSVKQRLGQ